MKDFFISYNRHDKQWAEWIAWTLEEAGYTVVVEVWDFKPGGNFVLYMQAALTQSQTTIAVLSEHFLSAVYVYPEWATAFAQDPQGTQRKLIPVKVDECAPPGLLASIVYVDLVDCEVGAAQQRLLTGVSEGRLKPTSSPPYPGKASKRSVPNPVPFPGVITHSLTDTSPTPPTPPLSLSAYDAQTWVGRDELIADLTQKLESGYRILVLTGITGIGKTALAEHLVVNVQNKGVPFHRLNFDDRGQGRDFLSGALSLLPKLGEVVTTADQQDPQNALQHLLTALRSKPFLIQIDSLELLLEGSEEGGWSAFRDGLWVDFLQQLLAGQECQSQLLLTTQAVPEALETEGYKYPQYWDQQVVSGLAEDEQLALFSKNGLEPDQEGVETLRRLGKLYDGHPLVLQVIAKDILSRPFNGDVQRYWQHYQAEFDEGERDRRRGNSPRSLQLRVKQRVEASLKRLPADAYQMVCRASVYRRPVPESFWVQLVGEMTESEPWSALEVLRGHNLVEEAFRGDGVLLLRQHNLVRGVARQLLRSEPGEWQVAHQTAAQVWLRDYEPEAGAPNLEQLRGKLEAFHHYCEVEDWEAAKGILIDEGAGLQLYNWSYYREMLPLFERLLGKVGAAVDVVCEKSIGNAYLQLSDYPRAIQRYQQSLATAREISDRDGEGRALGNLGIVYGRLSDYPQAIEYHQQSVTIAREIGNRQGEGIALGNLGNAYYFLGDYPQAIEYHQQSLTIKREIGNRQGEGNSLGNLGNAYYSLGDYPRAIAYHEQQLTLTREIGDRQGEGNALGSLGAAYEKLGDYPQAIEYCQQFLTIAREIGYRQGEGNSLGNLGNAYYFLGDYPKAIEYQQQSLTIAREIGDRQGEGIALENWGETLLRLKQYPEAQQHLQAALDTFKALGFREGEAEALHSLAELYHQTGHPDLALDHCTQALTLSRELGIPLLKECEDFLATLQAETDTSTEPDAH